LIAVGLAGAALFSILIEKTHVYKIYLLICSWGSSLCLIFVVLSLVPNNTITLAVAWGLVGFFGLPLLPITLECGCEITFPVPEVVTNGLLMVCGQVTGVALTLGMTAMQDPVTKSMVIPSWVLFGFSTFASVVYFGFRPNYLRTAHDRKYEAVKSAGVSSLRFLL